ncbi:MAG: hypothetical protein QOI56_1262 [Actinomycetota bacterium]|nr:hypothetical protein [Actinomycetota bacterium]
MALPQTAPGPGAAPAPSAAGRAAMFPELGMRRVRWVAVSFTGDGVRAEVAGLAHRFPIVRPVTVQMANRLIRAGCPYVVRRADRAPAAAPAAPIVPGPASA